MPLPLFSFTFVYLLTRFKKHSVSAEVLFVTGTIQNYVLVEAIDKYFTGMSVQEGLFANFEAMIVRFLFDASLLF